MIFRVTVSSKGQIAIPKGVRDSLNLSTGSKLTLEVRGQEIVLSKSRGWRHLRGAAARDLTGRDLIDTFAEFRKQEIDGENSGL